MSQCRTLASTLVSLLIVALCAVSIAGAQEREPDNPVDTAPSSMAENVRRLIQSLSQLPSWEEERENMLSAVGSVFETNEWNSEPDLFALDLIRDMEQLPPTAFQQRFDTLVGALSDRYMLSEEQEKMMRRTIQRESQDLFMKHSGRIMQYGLEAIQTRVSGEPFTPEQVARWTQLAEPVFLDARARVRTAADRFMGELDPEQQALLRRDMDADNRRAEKMIEMAQGWKRGEWRAADWGLESDPIQSKAASATESASATGNATNPDGTPTADRLPGKPPDPVGGGQPVEPPPGGDTLPPDGPEQAPGAAPEAPTAAPTRTVGVDDKDEWAQYVRGFIHRYSLDDGQQQRAWLIYREVRQHRDQLLTRAAARAGAAAADAPAKGAEGRAAGKVHLDDKQKAAVERLFEQLKRRLERLPTRAQRKAAAAAPDLAPAPKPREKP